MASTVTAQNLEVSITESITLAGTNYNQTKSLVIPSIKEVYKRVVRCIDDTDCTIATFRTATNTADNALDLENVKYIRVTNLDDTNPMNLSLQIAIAENATANASATHLIGAGQSLILYTVHDGLAVSDANATIVTSLNDLESILVDPLSENIDVEIFVASI
jgi:hypothetical protein|tara:strand:- start:3393 stop:3878 length:486 start_codon:yes stop_codon:yes gene_type:complete